MPIYVFINTKWGWGWFGVHQSSFYHCLSIIYYISDKMSASPPTLQMSFVPFLTDTPTPQPFLYFYILYLNNFQSSSTPPHTPFTTTRLVYKRMAGQALNRCHKILTPQEKILIVIHQKIKNKLNKLSKVIKYDL